jgi:peptidoglycan lytic transglycosylase
LGAAGCGSSKPKLAPPTPQPAMPPGVTWGAPAPPPAAPAAAGARSATVPEVLEPAPALARRPLGGLLAELPDDNYSADPRAGEVWETGVASFYGLREQGHDTASGQKFDYHKMTAAHRLLPLGTRVLVTDLRTHKSVKVLINDRGPFWPHRILDLSYGAAQKVGDEGLDPVRIKILSLPHPVPAGVYTVQVGWFTNSRQLRQCRQRMQRDLHQPVIEFGSNEGRWIRYAKSVHLDQATALRIAADLRQRSFPAYPVRLN